jgi:hypothetical protein
VQRQLGSPLAGRFSAAKFRGLIIQRASTDKDWHVTTGKVQREFLSDCAKKHLRVADITSYSQAVDMADEIYKWRKKRDNITANTVVFMTSYQEQLFKEQQHTDLGVQDQYGWKFVTTTQFPITQSTDNGHKLYSAAQFTYAANFNEDTQTWYICHVYGMSGASPLVHEAPLKSDPGSSATVAKHIFF